MSEASMPDCENTFSYGTSSVSLGLEEYGQPFATMSSLFKQIPPERIGLNGEYDYYGLSKRVQAKLEALYRAEDIAQLKVRQRGAMIVLLGNVSNRTLLNQIVRLAMSVDGAVGVEYNGVSFVPPSISRPCPDLQFWRTSHQFG